MKKMNVVKLFVSALVATAILTVSCKKDETTAPQTTADAGTGGQCIAGNTSVGGNTGGTLPTGGSTASGGSVSTGGAPQGGGGSEPMGGSGGN
jgi:hypothetical protein